MRKLEKVLTEPLNWVRGGGQREYLVVTTDQEWEIRKVCEWRGIPAEDLARFIDVSISLISDEEVGEWLVINGDTMVTDTPRATWESLVRMSVGEFEGYWLRIHGPPSRCVTCKTYLREGDGIEGETLLWCPEGCGVESEGHYGRY